MVIFIEIILMRLSPSSAVFHYLRGKPFLQKRYSIHTLCNRLSIITIEILHLKRSMKPPIKEKKYAVFITLILHHD